MPPEPSIFEHADADAGQVVPHVEVTDWLAKWGTPAETPAKGKDTATGWVDPDEAPEWTDEVFDRAAIYDGDKLIRPAQGTLTRRGRPKLDSPKRQVTLRLDQEVLDGFRETGPGWQGRINEALRKSLKV